MTGDGTGGLWLSGSGCSQPGRHLVHYAGGRSPRRPWPTEPAYDAAAGELAAGSRRQPRRGGSVPEPTGNGIDEGVIFRYGG